MQNNNQKSRLKNKGGELCKHMEIEITGTEKKLFSCMDSEGLIGNEELAMDETGFPSISTI